jgi:2'-5' RNA ligase
VPSENLHLTLEFLGAVDEDRVPGLVEAVRALPPGPPGPVRLRRLQARPSPRRPRLVAAVLDDLEGGVRARRDQVRAAVAAALGRPPADEAFWPHVTLVRYTRPGRLSGLPEDEPGWERTFAVGRAALYDSVTIPGGPPRYDALARAQSGP